MSKEEIRNHIFMSYSRDDAEKAHKLKEHIENTVQCSAVWLDQEDIHAGDLWRRQIVEAIEDCRVFISVLSTHSIHSDNVRRELDIARDRNKPVLPVLVELKPNHISKEMEYQLSGLQRVEYSQMFEEGIRHLEKLMQIPATRLMPVASAVLKHESGVEIPLLGTHLTVGRGPEADIDLTKWDRHQFVSRQHAELSYEAGHWNLRSVDQASNPTAINGKSVPKGSEVSLKFGDQIAFANIVFHFDQIE
jgi:hypothetical protein